MIDVTITMKEMQHAAIVDSLQLTPAGKRAASYGTGTPAVLSLADAVVETASDRAGAVARVIRSRRSIVAVPAKEAASDPLLARVSLCVRFLGVDLPVATVEIPGRHAEGKPDGRSLAKVIAELLR